MPSATLADLLAQDHRVELAISCLNKLYVGEFEQHRLKGGASARFSVAEIISLYGGEATVEQIRLKLRCKVCGARDKGIVISVVNLHQPGYSAGGYRWPEE